MAPPPKRQKTEYNARTKSVTTLKKRIRDVERLLSNPNSSISADGRVEKERALAAFNLELTTANRNKKEQAMAKKYHMVRFFERQKASRKLKKLEREINAHEGEAPAELRAQALAANVEVNYTLHYPPGEPYISLYKDAGTSTEKREMFKKDIELRMEKGTLGARTTEPMHAEGGERRPAKKEKPAAATAKSNKRKAEPEKKVDECKIEDDDFFEF